MDIVDIINFYNPNIIKPQSKLLPAQQITFFPSTHDAIVGYNFYDVDDQEIV